MVAVPATWCAYSAAQLPMMCIELLHKNSLVPRAILPDLVILFAIKSGLHAAALSFIMLETF